MVTIGGQALNKFCYLPSGWNDAWQTAKAASGTTQANLLQIGDSVGQGFVSTDVFAKGYFGLMRANLLKTYTLGGDFYGPQMNATFDSHVTTPPYVYGAGARSFGNGGRGYWIYNNAVYAGNFVTFTTPYACTAIDIHYGNYTAGAFDYSVDGGGAVTQTVTGSGGTGPDCTHAKISLTGLANTTHTIAFQNPTATPASCLITGITTWKSTTTGINFANMSVSGFSSANFVTRVDSASNPLCPALYQGYTPQKEGQGSASQIANNTGYGFPTQPHLAIIQLGINDLQQSVSAATFATNVTYFIQAFRRGQPNASIILLGASNPDGVNSDMRTPFTGAKNWQQYLLQMFTLAQMFNCAFVNIHAKWGELGVTSGFQASGDGHPLDAGHQDIANVLNTII